MMRCFCAEARKQKQINRETEKQLLLEKKNERRKLRVLLLGKKNFSLKIKNLFLF
jgi:hypothetical protein